MKHTMIMGLYFILVSLSIQPSRVYAHEKQVLVASLQNLELPIRTCSLCLQPLNNQTEIEAARCSHCSAHDPMEDTTQLVLAQVPVVFDNFMKIVQDPNNKETVPQHITAIVSSIVHIAASAFKGKDRIYFEETLRKKIEHYIVEQIPHLNNE